MSDTSTSAGRPLDRWWTMFQRVCCLVVLVLTALILWRVTTLGTVVRQQAQTLGNSDGQGPVGAPIQPEPDSVNIVGRVTQSGTGKNGETINLLEDIGGQNWVVIRTTVTHVSQHNVQAPAPAPYGEAGWYTFFELTRTPTTRNLKACRLKNDLPVDCQPFSLTSQTTKGNHQVGEIVMGAGIN